jgi:hypothetical protein
MTKVTSKNNQIQNKVVNLKQQKSTKQKTEAKVSIPAKKSNPIKTASPKINKANSYLSKIFLTLITISVIFVVCLLSGYLYLKNKQTKETSKKEPSTFQTEEKISDEEIIKENNKNEEINQAQEFQYVDIDYGFKLNLNQLLKNYRVQKEPQKGNLHLLDINFYFPTTDPIYSKAYYSKIPGYIKLFTISVLDKENFDNPARNKTKDELNYGILISKNEEYVFTYSSIMHNAPTTASLSDELPEDISSNLYHSMEKAIININTLSNTEQSTLSKETFLSLTQGNLVKVDKISLDNFKQENSQYYNCIHQFSLYHPTDWLNEKLTKKSNTVTLEGNNIYVSITPYSKRSYSNLEDFAYKVNKKITGNFVSSESKIINKTKIITYELKTPNSVEIYWEGPNNYLELKIFGKNFQSELYKISHLIGTLIPNNELKECEEE